MLEKASRYTVPTLIYKRRSKGKNWQELLKDCLLICPHCSYLVFGWEVREEKSYSCESCGHGFLGKRLAAKGNSQIEV
jgi:hypothetical protein